MGTRNQFLWGTRNASLLMGQGSEPPGRDSMMDLGPTRVSSYILMKVDE